MKNYSKIIFVVLLPLLLAGCTYPWQKPVQKESGQATEQGQKEEGWSLKKALSLGESIKCTFKSEQGETNSWVKGNKMKVIGSNFGKSGNGGMINDGEYIYIWGDNEKDGMKYKLSALQQEDQGKPVDNQFESWKNPEKWASEVESKYKTECGKVVINDNEFVPPDNVTFKDLTETFEQMKNYQKNIPSNMPIPSIDMGQQGGGGEQPSPVTEE